MKKKILILFKAPWHWNKFVIKKFSKFYDVKYLYLDQIKKNYLDTVAEINSFIDKNKIEIVFFDVDYQKFINLFFIKKIKNIKKIMMTFDDYERHDLNSITGAGCDVILSACPISVFRYAETGYSAHFMPLEADGNFYKNMKISKEIEVLFFGKVNEDRKNYIEHIKNNGIKIKVVGNNEENRVSDEEIANLICKSKIVVNFSKSTWDTVKTIPEGDIFKFNYQFKGRIIQSGLCGTACVTEYAPHHSLLFTSEELLEFNTKEQCVRILKDLLNDSKKLLSYTEKLENKVKNFYEEEKSFKSIYDTIDKPSIKKENLKTVPFWYLRIAAKQILIRDANILKFFGTLRQFKEVLKIIKKSKIYVQLLIMGESLLNMFWYSIIRTFKEKGVGKNRYLDKL
tara:strand:- start:169 stop:1362 length:1194 start_codon:yes stop_codon:yes gene_type:complete